MKAATIIPKKVYHQSLILLFQINLIQLIETYDANMYSVLIL